MQKLQDRITKFKPRLMSKETIQILQNNKRSIVLSKILKRQFNKDSSDEENFDMSGA